TVRYSPPRPRQQSGLLPSTAALETKGTGVRVGPPLTPSSPRAGEIPVRSVAIRPVQLSELPIRLYPFEVTGPEQSAPPDVVTVLPATIVFRSRMTVSPPGLFNPPPARRAELPVMVTLRRSVVPTCA